MSREQHVQEGNSLREEEGMQRCREEGRYRVPEEKTSWEAVVEQEGRCRTLVTGEEGRGQEQEAQTRNNAQERGVHGQKQTWVGRGKATQLSTRQKNQTQGQ